MKTNCFTLFVVIMCTTLAAFAVPATPLPIEITLADGTITQVYLRGDEYASYYTTLDGTPIRIEQGKIMEDYTLPVQTLKKRKLAQEASVSLANFPTIGTPRSIVLLVNFTDCKFIKNKQDFENMLNQSGYSANGAIGSARDYFIASSDSLFQPQFDVYGPFDLPNDMAYYGARTNGMVDKNPQQMIIDACAAADADGVDFSQYDYNNDDVIDDVFVYYAGNNESEGADENTIWPHRSFIPVLPQFDGKCLYGYACTSELKGQRGTTMCGIGTFCHEFSHVLGLADLYDIDYTKNTVGYWDIMCNGSYNGNGCQPPSYTAFERFSVGWLTPELLTEPQECLLEPLETANKAYMISATGDSVEANTNAEYFLLENRQRVGWDAGSSCIPGEGMLVWHINYNSVAWTQNRPNSGNNLMCNIESATGWKQTQGSASDPFPGTRNKTVFMPILDDGTNLNKPLWNIQQLDNKGITFSFSDRADITLLPVDLTPFNSTFTRLSNGEIVREMPAQKLILMGDSLHPELLVNITTSKSNFQLSLDSIDWNTELHISPQADSTLNASIYVRYYPTMQMCDYDEGNIQIQHGGLWYTLDVYGIAPRVVLITEPMPQEPTNISSSSAELNWKAVYDATHYYVSVYQQKDSIMSFSESFEYFDSPTAVAEAGWQTNVNTLSYSYNSSGIYSLWVKETGGQVVSARYDYPISHLSFWYSVPATDVETVGTILIEGYNGIQWNKIDSLIIKQQDNSKTYSITFNETQSYTQFRLLFTIIEESNGICIDDFNATCDKLIEYLFDSKELILNAIDGEENVKFKLNELEPSTEYYYKIRVSDKGHNGCEEHIKEMNQPQRFRTLDITNNEIYLNMEADGIQYNPISHTIRVPNTDGDGVLYFYTIDGVLIEQMHVTEQYTQVALLEGHFISGQMYIVRYMVADSLESNHTIKIIY